MKSVYDVQGNLVGTFDGEYIYNKAGDMEIRVDEDEVYTAGTGAKYLGTFDGSNIISLQGTIVYTIS